MLKNKFLTVQNEHIKAQSPVLYSKMQTPWLPAKFGSDWGINHRRFRWV
jgi:hypothetical protein